jgi:hypothetical protein
MTKPARQKIFCATVEQKYGFPRSVWQQTEFREAAEEGLGGHSEYPDEVDGKSIEETNESYTPSDKRRAG